MSESVIEVAKPAKTAHDASWRMPHTYIGQTVLWYEGGVRSEATAFYAHVSKVSARGLALHIWRGDSTVPMIRECVRHMDDPKAREDETVVEGRWDYCENAVDRPKRRTCSGCGRQYQANQQCTNFNCPECPDNKDKP